MYVGSSGTPIVSSLIHVSESNSGFIVGENNFISVNSTCISNSSIIGGCDNKILDQGDGFLGRCGENTILGGHTNCIYGGGNSLIGGGNNNCVFNSNSAILSGQSNKVECSTNSAIIGGLQNLIQESYGFIGHGSCNRICGATNGHNVIVSGCCNNITRPTFASGAHNCFNFIGGGHDNTISGSCGGILGGHCNTITDAVSNSFIIGSNLSATDSCTTYINNLQVEGDTLFGTNNNDIHQVTGSVHITGPLEVTGSLNVDGSLVVDGPISSTVFVNSYSSDSAAGAAGVPVYGLYRNGSFLIVRLS